MRSVSVVRTTPDPEESYRGVQGYHQSLTLRSRRTSVEAPRSGTGDRASNHTGHFLNGFVESVGL